MKTRERKHFAIRQGAWIVLALLLAACAPGLSAVTPEAGETVGETFRKVMAQIDANCRERKLGPYEPEPRKTGVRNASCDILFLKPEDPLSTPEGRFAHALKLPAPHDVPKDVLRPGMTGEEYFKALCEAEAGEWVFRTVGGVKGIRQLRPYSKANYYSLMGAYYAAEILVADLAAHVENPAGYLIASDVKRWPTYQYLEIPVGGDSKASLFKRLFKDTSVLPGPPSYGINHIESVSPQSKYGYAWRSIERIHARENGVLGAELILLDVDTSEVLAFRRHFYRLRFDSTYRSSREMFANICKNKKFDSSFAFITRVIQPVKGDEK